MPRKFFKRIMPNPHEVRQNRFIRIFGDFLHDPNLWHLNRRSAAGATALGLFLAFVPLPVQMISAVALAIVFRVNLPITLAGVWVTNPLTIPPMFFFAYEIGTWVLGTPTIAIDFSQLGWEWIQTEMLAIWKPFLLGCLICGIGSAGIGYALVRLTWRVHLIQRLRERKERKKS